jgi:nucleotide-binding universal stress UspA family protein
MFRHVMVGVDGGDGGRDAIALAKLLLAEDGELTLASVYHSEPVAWRGSSAAYEAAEREDVHDLLEKARTDAELEAKLRWRGAPSVGRGLHELAETTGADLLVIGSSRRGLLGRVLIGDDTRTALNGAPCAVAIAPAGYAQQPDVTREVGVGYNGSPESEHALGVARQLAARYGTKLSAFEAVSIPASVTMAGAALVYESIEELVQEARDRIELAGDVEGHAAFGQTSEELALYSASLDLLVIGSRSYGPIGRLVHGSTAQQLARSARCPLLVLTRAARKADTAHVSEDGNSVTRSPALS